MRVIFYFRKNKSKFISPAVDWIRDIVITDLTIGKEYEVIQISEDGRYLIENDQGLKLFYDRFLFTRIEDIRDDKLKELGIE